MLSLAFEPVVAHCGRLEIISLLVFAALLAVWFRCLSLTQVAKALLRAGAAVNLRTPSGTALEILLREENPSSALVRELVLAGADLGLEGGIYERVRWCCVLVFLFHFFSA